MTWATDEQIKKVYDILESHGIRMDIYGCGCCGSPTVKFEYNGEVVVPEVDCFMLDMCNGQDYRGNLE